MLMTILEQARYLFRNVQIVAQPYICGIPTESAVSMYDRASRVGNFREHPRDPQIGGRANRVAAVKQRVMGSKWLSNPAISD